MASHTHPTWDSLAHHFVNCLARLLSDKGRRESQKESHEDQRELHIAKILKSKRVLSKERLQQIEIYVNQVSKVIKFTIA